MPDDSTRKPQDQTDKEGASGLGDGTDRNEPTKEQLLNEHLESLRLWNLYLDRKISLRQLIERLPGNEKHGNGSVEKIKDFFDARDINENT